jgi:hypothetical protein
MAVIFSRRANPVGTAASERRETTFVIGRPPGVVLRQAETALRRVGVRRPRVDAAALTVRGRRRMSAASFGEVITVTVQALPDGNSARVIVRSNGWPFTPIFDWGVNQRNVENVRREIERDD